MRSIVRPLALLLVLAASMLPAQAPQRAVLVTGASSGIGRKIAELLATEGFYVYAGARKPEDIAELSKIANMKGIRLDVTSATDVANAVASIQKDGRGLYGVVNNAGIATGGALILTEEKEIQQVMDVNVMGPWRVTKAFGQMLIASKGRVVTVSSISGILSGPLFGVYSMSKHAIEAFSDALGAEMAPLGVTSSLIEPGNYKSDIGLNTLATIQAAADRAKGTSFELPIQGLVRAMGNYHNYPEPDDVARAALHAFTSPKPQARYMVVPAANQALVTVRKAMEEMVQLNHGHQFSIPRDSLVTMMDQLMARLKQP